MGHFKKKKPKYLWTQTAVGVTCHKGVESSLLRMNSFPIALGGVNLRSHFSYRLLASNKLTTPYLLTHTISSVTPCRYSTFTYTVLHEPHVTP